MTDEDFIEQSIGFQLGGALDHRLETSQEARQQALSGSSGGALAWDSSRTQPYPENGWYVSNNNSASLANQQKSVNTLKAIGALDSLLAAGVLSDFLVDMQDRRLRNLLLEDGRLFPVFCFNRSRDDTARILWPLSGYHDIGSAAFLGPFATKRIAWAQKRPKVVWRGQLSGRADWHGDVRREGLRLRPLLKKFRSGEFDLARVERNLLAFPRYRLASETLADPMFDVGFTGADGIALADIPKIEAFVRPVLSQHEMARNKFILVLRGMDVGSSFYWTLNSGSLALVMEGPFQTFGSCLFEPWKHYVPFKSDLSDLRQRLDWCLENDHKCQQMVESARQRCALLAREDLRKTISCEIASLVNKKLGIG